MVDIQAMFKFISGERVKCRFFTVWKRLGDTKEGESVSGNTQEIKKVYISQGR